MSGFIEGEDRTQATLFPERTVEHPFGTIKSWIGGPTHFQMRTLKHVNTEMSLHVLAYNLKRMLQIFGAVSLMETMRA